MSINFRFPNITGISDREQIAQIKSYLHQLVEQLNYAFSTGGSSGDSTTSSDGQGSQSYDELKNFLMQEIQRLNNRIDQMSKPVVGVDYFTEEDKAKIVNEVLAALKEE